MLQLFPSEQSVSSAFYFIKLSLAKYLGFNNLSSNAASREMGAPTFFFLLLNL
jgi:hypothetical protein